MDMLQSGVLGRLVRQEHVGHRDINGRSSEPGSKDLVVNREWRRGRLTRKEP